MPSYPLTSPTLAKSSLETMMKSPEFAEASADMANFVNPKYAHVMVTDETWIIGPEPR